MTKKTATDTRHQREQSVGFLLNLLTRRVNAAMKERLAEAGLDMKSFVNLRVLSEGDGIRQKDLGRILEFAEYQTSRNVDSLVAAGLVERRPDPNSRRAVRVHLTAKGRQTAAGLHDLVDEVNEAFLRTLTAAEQKRLRGLLQKLAGVSGAGGPDR